MLYLVFKEDKDKNKEPLFAYSDNSVNIERVIGIDTLLSLFSDKYGKAEDKVTVFPISDLYFENANKAYFYVLIKVVNGDLISEISVSNEYKDVERDKILFEKFADSDLGTTKYTIFRFKGTLDI